MRRRKFATQTVPVWVSQGCCRFQSGREESNGSSGRTNCVYGSALPTQSAKDVLALLATDPFGIPRSTSAGVRFGKVGHRFLGPQLGISAPRLWQKTNSAKLAHGA